MTTAPLIEVQDLRIDLADGGSHVAAVEGVSFRIDRGETFGLVGESGCGKSITALALIGLLRRPLSIAAGAIRFEGREIQGLSAAEQRALRGNRIAMIFQEPMTALNPVVPVGRQIDEVLLAGGSARLPGLVDQLSFLFAEDSDTHITGSIDSDQVIARGNAVYAHTIVHVPKDAEERKFIETLANTRRENIDALSVPATARPVGLVLDAPQGADAERVEKQLVDGQLFVPLVDANTPVPARRALRFPVAEGAASTLLRIAEATPEVRVDTIQPEPLDEDDEDDEPLEPEEVKTAYYKPDAQRLVELVVPTSGAKTVTVELVVLSGGQITVEAKVDDAADVAASAKIGA